MKTLTVRQQLTMAFGSMSVLVLLVSLLGLRSLGASNEQFSDYIRGAAERQKLATEVRILANRRAIGVRDMVVASSDADHASAKAMAVNGHTDLQDKLKALQESVARAADATESDRAMVSKIAEVESRYGPVAVAIVELAATGKRDEAIQKMNAECRPLLAALLAATREYVQFSAQRAVGADRKLSRK